MIFLESLPGVWEEEWRLRLCGGVVECNRSALLEVGIEPSEEVWPDAASAKMLRKLCR